MSQNVDLLEKLQQFLTIYGDIPWKNLGDILKKFLDPHQLVMGKNNFSLKLFSASSKVVWNCLRIVGLKQVSGIDPGIGSGIG